MHFWVMAESRHMCLLHLLQHGPIGCAEGVRARVPRALAVTRRGAVRGHGERPRCMTRVRRDELRLVGVKMLHMHLHTGPGACADSARWCHDTVGVHQRRGRCCLGGGFNECLPRHGPGAHLTFLNRRGTAVPLPLPPPTTAHFSL